MIKAKKINLLNQKEKDFYSEKLKEFEKEFIYPFGGQAFYIQHGLKDSYFDFFEKLGEVNYFILEDDNKIIGAISAILREIDGNKVWYLCDFKISRKYRGKKLYKKLMWKFFLPCYIKCQNMFSINMSKPENNKLWKHTKTVFKLFNIEIAPQYLYTFKGKDLVNLNTSFWQDHIIVSNNGTKDIVLEGINQKLYHIVNKKHFKNNLSKFTKIMPNEIFAQDTVMFLNAENFNIHFGEKTTISLISKGGEKVYISSAEI